MKNYNTFVLKPTKENFMGNGKILFETERLKIRELVIEDSKSLSGVLSDKESMKYYNSELSYEEVGNWILRNIARYKKDGYGLWAVIRKNDGVFLGDCGITIQNIDNELLPEVGFHIINKYCRNGYASEAAKGCIHYIYKEFGIQEIYSYCRIGNLPSQGVMKKIGMEFWKKYMENGVENIVYQINADIVIGA